MTNQTKDQAGELSTALEKAWAELEATGEPFEELHRRLLLETLEIERLIEIREQLQAEGRINEWNTVPLVNVKFTVTPKIRALDQAIERIKR